MRGAIRGLLVALLVVPAVIGLSPVAPVAAANGLRIENTTTYTIDPVSGLVKAQVDLVLTNTVPDKREGNVISRAFFTGFTLPVPVGASNGVAVTSTGRGLTLTPELVADFEGYYLFNIDFASRLFYQQTTRITVTYDLLGQPPRDPNPSRVNPAYAAFTAYGVGDPGRVTVRVVVPSTFIVDKFGDDVAVSTEGLNTVYTAAAIESPDEFNVFISARDDSALASSEVTLAGHEFDIRYWPGDEAWREFVDEQVSEGLPALEELIGTPWPRTERFEIRQANSPYFYGYAGWFSGADNEIEMGEDLDQETMLHELSHAWFNSQLADSRWLNEGLAQAYSNRAIDALGGSAGSPETPARSDAGFVILDEWGRVDIEDVADEQEDYGYNASWYVIDALVDEIGEDKMRGVLSGLKDDTGTYPGEEDVDDLTFAVDPWQQLLDLSENAGGSEEIEELLTEWVLTADQTDLLDERTAARDAFAALDSEGGEWDVPVGVRNEMAEWDFDDATELVDEAGDVLTIRDKMVTLSDELDVQVPGDFEPAYQKVEDDFTEVVADLNDQIDALETVKGGLADEAEEPPFVERVGLIGTDLDTPLAEAREALGRGDTDTARSRVAEVLQVLADADEVGKGRIIRTVAGVVGGLLVLFLLIFGLRRRRRRKRRAAESASHPDAGVMVPLENPQSDDDTTIPRQPEPPAEPGDVIDGLEIPQSSHDIAGVEVGGVGGGWDGGGWDSGGGGDSGGGDGGGD